MNESVLYLVAIPFNVYHINRVEGHFQVGRGQQQLLPENLLAVVELLVLAANCGPFLASQLWLIMHGT
jgi:hypothetical protein